MEIIQHNFCNLKKNTKINIEKRSNEGINYWDWKIDISYPFFNQINIKIKYGDILLKYRKILFKY